jgi:hypothetical protein
VRAQIVAAVLGVLGLHLVAFGVWAGVDAASFADVVADYGPRNDHLVHDYGAASFAVGAGLLLAVRRTDWRVPMLVIAALWNGLHAASHLADVDDAASRALGVTEAALLVLSTVLLAGLAVAVKEET